MREDTVIATDVRTTVLAHRLDDPDAAIVDVEAGMVALTGLVHFAPISPCVIQRTHLPNIVEVIDHLPWTTHDHKPQVAALF